MKISKKPILCTAIAAVLGVGVTVAAAAQASNGNEEQYVSDTAGEPLQESGISQISESKSVDSSVSDVICGDGEELSVNPEESENPPGYKTEEAARPEAVKRFLPTANAPGDIDYCSVEDFMPSECWGGAVEILTEMRSEVYAVSGGEVIFADNDLGAGNMIIIKYEDGLFGEYFHLDFDGGMLVNKGDIVEAGQLIGLTGVSGIAAEPCFGYKCQSELSPSFLARYPEFQEL